MSSTAWREIGRRPECRLTAHFFAAMFDFGILTPAGSDSFIHMLLGAIGALIAIGLGATRVYAAKYAALSGGATPDPYRVAVLGDDLFLTGLPMLLGALLTVLVSQSTFPDERDFRILGPLPVRRFVIVGAKFAALFAFAGMFVTVIHIGLTPMMLLTSLSRFREHAVLWRVGAWMVSSLAASLFSVLAITAATGIFMLVLSRSRLHSLTALTRSVMLATLVLCVPFVFHLPGLGDSMSDRDQWLMFLPPAWFVGLQRLFLGATDPWFVRLAAIAIGALVVASSIVAAVYIILFRHFERLLLRPPSVSRGWFQRTDSARSNATSHSTRQSTRVARSPAFRAVHRFTTATLARSQLHQAVVLGLSACGLALATNGLVGSELVSRLEADEPASAVLINAATWAPFALMFVCGISIRAAVALPMTHHANWIFRLTESDDGRREQMRAVNQVVTAYVVGLSIAVTAPLLWLVLGAADAIMAAVIIGSMGLVFVHVVLLDWRRIPFTCSYLPGKRLLAHTLVLGFAAFVLFTLAGTLLVHIALVRPAFGPAVAALLLTIAWVLRRRRFAMWKETPLIFDDDLPDQPLQLGL
jgi:hypothetical protein